MTWNMILMILISLMKNKLWCLFMKKSVYSCKMFSKAEKYRSFVTHTEKINTENMYRAFNYFFNFYNK